MSGRRVLHFDLGGGGWLSFDDEGKILAVEIPGLGVQSFEMLRDAVAEADANLERRRREIDDDQEDSGG